MQTDITDPIIQRLQTLAQDTPDLKGAAEVYAAILPILREADLHAVPISMSVEEARRKLESGLALLHDLDLELDHACAQRLMIDLASAVEHSPSGRPASNRPFWQRGPTPDTSPNEGHGPVDRRVAARRIRLALEQDHLDSHMLLPYVAAGESEFVATLAEGLDLDPGLVWTLAQNALRPALRTWCRQLSPLLERGAWSRGTCPICSATATLGELQGNEQVKHLRCLQCGADWSFARMQCIYCGNEDHRTLGYLYPDGKREQLWIEFCDRCGGYLKVRASFSPTPAELLPVEDLATLYLDYVAQERGYTRVAVR